MVSLCNDLVLFESFFGHVAFVDCVALLFFALPFWVTVFYFFRKVALMVFTVSICSNISRRDSGQFCYSVLFCFLISVMSSLFMHAVGVFDMR